MRRRIRLMVLFLIFVLMISGCGASANSNQSGNEQTVSNQNSNEQSGSKQSGNEQDSGTQSSQDSSSGSGASGTEDDYYLTMELDEDASYDTKDEVCAYLVQFHRLPSNYMTKKEARSEGWEGGALNQVVPGKCIGGDVFTNYEEVLPVVDDRVYHECDIDTLGSTKRGAKRIIYSGDDRAGEWNVYYTDDHYETFTLLWGNDS